MGEDTIGMDASSDQMSSEIGKLACLNHDTSEQVPKLDPGTAHFELSETTNQIGSEFLDNEKRVLGTGVTSSLIDEKLHQVSDSMNGNSIIQLPAPPQSDLDKSCQTGEGSCLQHHTSEQVSGSLSNYNSDNKYQLASQNVQNEPVERSDALTSSCVKDQIQLVPAEVNVSYANEQLETPSRDIAKSTSPDCLERNSKRAAHIRLGCKAKRASKSLKKKYMLRSLGSSDRVLRSRTGEKPKAPESNTNLVNVDNNREKRKGRKKKNKRRGEGMTNEFSRIKARLRYLLNRVSYEQSLIDAYSGEGWKGYSVDKLKPEKELQRAKFEILRRKLKIRDLFRHLDTLCAEGRLLESLFDSEGEIDSEDIFCAKCRSKDLTTDNDIILCDGSCDRGFHQFCLEPPLLTENIPPDDEGWLCPGCDCKDDCIKLLNDSLGTSLSFSDTWERVFPEAAAVAGNNVDHKLGLPSDDSADDDYNPDVPEDEEVEGGKSSSDESENASASDKSEASINEDPYLGLPSEDSEDDDFNPNAPDPGKDVAEESSSSDFTSDSEDLADAIKANTFSVQDENPISPSLDDIKKLKGSAPQKCKVGKKPSLASELSSLLELDPGPEASTPLSGKRQLERLDYKKLYDETYQNVQSDTSDDEDWSVTATFNRKKKFTGKGAPVSPNGKVLTPDHLLKEATHTPRRSTRQHKVENTDNSPTKSLEGSKNSGSNDQKPGSSTYKRLGEDAVKILYNSFKENQYPVRATKESLAQELGLTFRQVSKWFENTRWSFRNSSRMEVSAVRNPSQPASSSRVENEGALGEDHKLVPREGNVQNSKSPSSGKRKHRSDPQVSDANQDVGSAATKPPAGSPRVSDGQGGHKMKTKRRK